MKVVEYYENLVKEKRPKYEHDKKEWEKERADEMKKYKVTEEELEVWIKEEPYDRERRLEERFGKNFVKKMDKLSWDILNHKCYEDYQGLPIVWLGRQSDNKRMSNYYQTGIIAEFENEFGFAFILKTERANYCYLLMKSFMKYTGTYAHNQLIEYGDKIEFMKQFGDKLIVNDAEEFGNFKKMMIFNQLNKQNE